MSIRTKIQEEVKHFIFIRQKGRCAHCDELLRCTDDRIPLYDYDHIIPLCEFGSNESYNLQILCLECHRIKSIRERRGKSKTRIKTRRSEEEEFTSNENNIINLQSAFARQPFTSFHSLAL